jgi:hypothetical protein
MNFEIIAPRRFKSKHPAYWGVREAWMLKKEYSKVRRLVREFSK